MLWVDVEIATRDLKKLRKRFASGLAAADEIERIRQMDALVASYIEREALKRAIFRAVIWLSFACFALWLPGIVPAGVCAFLVFLALTLSCGLDKLSIC